MPTMPLDTTGTELNNQHRRSESGGRFAPGRCVETVADKELEMQVAEKAYDDIVDLFARGTPPEEIVKFRPSRKARARARDLIERSKTDGLTSDEAAELERFGDLEHLMQLVKARARLYLDQEL